MTPFEEAAYVKGVEACRAADTLEDNPFTVEHLAAAWEDGYDDCLATGEFRHILMSRKLIFVAHGTPIGCDPSSETYWSM